ncbi:MAG TPA: hypothetical protein VN200_00035 [Rhodoglobus sp.]|nr:hypothetical protein [Rhodoglobus sp.]
MRTPHRIGRAALAVVTLATVLAAPLTAHAEEVPPTAAADTTPPVVTVTSPQAGAVYRVGTALTVDFECQDPEAAVIVCDGVYNADGQTVVFDTPGEYQWTYVAHTDAPLSTSVDVRFRVVPDDTAPPVIDWQVRASAPTAWQTAPTEVLFWIAEEPGGSGIASLMVTDSRTGEVTSSTGGAVSVTADQDGVTDFSAVATDVAGNVSAPAIVSVRIDDAIPYIDVLGPTGDAVFQRGDDVTLQYACHDDASGIDLCYAAGGDALDTSTIGGFTKRIWTRDNVGRVVFLDYDYSVVARSDTPPSIGLELPALPDSGGYVGPVPFRIVASDDDGVNAIHWRIDGGAWQAVEADSVDLVAPCGTTTTVEYWAIDDGGMRTESITETIESVCPEEEGGADPAPPTNHDGDRLEAPVEHDDTGDAPAGLAMTGSVALPLGLLAALLLLAGAAALVILPRRS